MTGVEQEKLSRDLQTYDSSGRDACFPLERDTHLPLGRDSHLVPLVFDNVRRFAGRESRAKRCEKGFTHQPWSGPLCVLCFLAASVFLLSTSLHAQDSSDASQPSHVPPSGATSRSVDASPTSETAPPGGKFAKLSAPEAVAEGNEELLAGHAGLALQAYEHAERLRPGTREIAFATGLAHYERGAFDEAREAFRRVAGGEQDDLAADAQYSLATCDHAEALQNMDNPELAMERFESAMRQYHDVLADHPMHEPARDANYKAASMWRQIKQQQKEEQKKQDGDENKDNEDKNDDEQQKSDNQDNDNEKKNQEPKDSDQQDQDQQEEQKEQSSEQKEQRVSREQAERKLREMMQAMREREKKRAEKVQLVRPRRVEKDW